MLSSTASVISRSGRDYTTLSQPHPAATDTNARRSAGGLGRRWVVILNPSLRTRGLQTERELLELLRQIERIEEAPQNCEQGALPTRTWTARRHPSPMKPNPAQPVTRSATALDTILDKGWGINI